MSIENFDFGIVQSSDDNCIPACCESILNYFNIHDYSQADIRTEMLRLLKNGKDISYLFRLEQVFLKVKLNSIIESVINEFEEINQWLNFINGHVNNDHPVMFSLPQFEIDGNDEIVKFSDKHIHVRVALKYDGNLLSYYEPHKNFERRIHTYKKHNLEDLFAKIKGGRDLMAIWKK